VSLGATPATVTENRCMSGRLGAQAGRERGGLVPQLTTGVASRLSKVRERKKLAFRLVSFFSFGIVFDAWQIVLVSKRNIAHFALYFLSARPCTKEKRFRFRKSSSTR
jgi:hypothetical protein